RAITADEICQQMCSVQYGASDDSEHMRGPTSAAKDLPEPFRRPCGIADVRVIGTLADAGQWVDISTTLRIPEERVPVFANESTVAVRQSDIRIGIENVDAFCQI